MAGGELKLRNVPAEKKFLFVYSAMPVPLSTPAVVVLLLQKRRAFIAGHIVADAGGKTGSECGP